MRKIGNVELVVKEERKIKRLELEKPVLEAFYSWVDSNINKILPKSKIGKTLQYAKIINLD